MIGKPSFGPVPTKAQTYIIAAWREHWTIIPMNCYRIRPGYYDKGDLARLLRAARFSDERVSFIADMME